MLEFVYVGFGIIAIIGVLLRLHDLTEKTERLERILQYKANAASVGDLRKDFSIITKNHYDKIDQIIKIINANKG